MRNRLVWVALLAVVGCKEKAEAEPPSAPAATNISAAQVASGFAQVAAALAQAQAAASAGGVSAARPAASVATSASAASSAAAVESSFSATLSNELGRLGFSTDVADLVTLGKGRGALLNGLGRLAGHASALSALLNNDKVVGAFMKRQDMQDACRNPEKMKPLLLYVLGSPSARAWVNDVDSVKALATTKLGLQLQSCPAFKALAQQPKTLATLTRGDTAAALVVNHPNFRAELDRLKIRQDAAGSRSSKK